MGQESASGGIWPFASGFPDPLDSEDDQPSVPVQAPAAGAEQPEPPAGGLAGPDQPLDPIALGAAQAPAGASGGLSASRGELMEAGSRQGAASPVVARQATASLPGAPTADIAGTASKPWEQAADPWGWGSNSENGAIPPPYTALPTGVAPGASADASSTRRRAVIVGVGVLVLLLAVGSVSLAVTRWGAGRLASPAAERVGSTHTTGAGDPSSGDSSEPSTDPSPDPTVTTSSGSPSTQPSTADSTAAARQVEAQAKQTLNYLADQGKQTVSLDSRWVSQLASKWIGITDPLQRTASGSHTFKASDILAEHTRLKSGQNAGAYVFMLRSTDFGLGKRPDRKILYVTFADGGFGSLNEVQRWCKHRFPKLSGKRLLNTCLPTRLKPVHG
jgi:hypothetical protein